MLGESDRGDAVEAGLGHIAVVLEADLHLALEAGGADGFLAPGGLLLGKCDADDLGAVVLCSMEREAGPATAHVEQSHSSLEPQLAADQVELLRLCFLEGRVGLGEHRARVGHRGAEDPAVEGVAHVVVVRDGVAVPALAVHSTAETDFFVGRCRARERERRERAVEPRLVLHGRAVDAEPGQAIEGGVEVAIDLELAGDVGARESDLPRG